MEKIRINDTKIHTYLSKKPYQVGVPLTCPVVEGKLVLIKATYETLPGDVYVNSIGYHPIIISKTEKIESNEGIVIGDWVYNTMYKKLFQMNGDITCYDFKVLALPEHFSPEQLQMIVDGKMKDGDKVVVECKIVAGARPPVKRDREYWHEIELNSQSHITLYPVEEKMYTREEVDKFFNNYREHLKNLAGKNKYYWGIYDGNVAVNFDSLLKWLDDKEWLKQNVK